MAHTGSGDIGSFSSGFLHPITGLDHLVAMIAVGIWGAVLGKPAMWILPLAFPLMMTVGGALGILGFQLPMVETVIALSDVILGLMVLFFVRAPLPIAGIIVSIFAIFHGFAHGMELPEAANPVGYSVGFVVGTGLLHMAGIGIGMVSASSQGKLILRATGLGITCTGIYFLLV